MDKDNWAGESSRDDLFESVVKLLRAYGYTREQLRLQYPEAGERVEQLLDAYMRELAELTGVTLTDRHTNEHEH